MKKTIHLCLVPYSLEITFSPTLLSFFDYKLRIVLCGLELTASLSLREHFPLRYRRAGAKKGRRERKKKREVSMENNLDP